MDIKNKESEKARRQVTEEAGRMTDMEGELARLRGEVKDINREKKQNSL